LQLYADAAQAPFTTGNASEHDAVVPPFSPTHCHVQELAPVALLPEVPAEHEKWVAAQTPLTRVPPPPPPPSESQVIQIAALVCVIGKRITPPMKMIAARISNNVFLFRCFFFMMVFFMKTHTRDE
jgi:hypothetical protein